MENGAFALFSIMIFQRRQKALLWSKGFKLCKFRSDQFDQGSHYLPISTHLIPVPCWWPASQTVWTQIRAVWSCFHDKSSLKCIWICAAEAKRRQHFLDKNILTGKRNATVKFCHVLHVAHKHELNKLTMTRIWVNPRRYFNLLILFTRYVIFFLLSNLSQILYVAFLSPVRIYW